MRCVYVCMFVCIWWRRWWCRGTHCRNTNRKPTKMHRYRYCAARPLNHFVSRRSERMWNQNGTGVSITHHILLLLCCIVPVRNEFVVAEPYFERRRMCTSTMCVEIKQILINALCQNYTTIKIQSNNHHYTRNIKVTAHFELPLEMNAYFNITY